ncbi:MAG: M56 family metallopeptidase [Gemmatimonas sp.]
MIAQWMLATVMIGVLLTIVGHCIAGFHARFAFPRRSLWLALMLLSTAVPVGVALRGNRSSSAQQFIIAPAIVGPAIVNPEPCCTVANTDVGTSASYFNIATFDIPLLVVWGILSLSLGAILVTAHKRTARRVQSWAEAEVCGEPVRIAPNFGPAAVGVVRATVVMPEWVLELSVHEQQLVLRHELEHIRAGDQFVLFAGVLLAVLMPWNLMLWWQLRRLRVGMELDCDARVAPSPRDRPRYADLLLRARRLQPVQQTALGFVSMRSALAERLYALLDRRQPSGVQMSAWSVSAVACVAMLVRVPVPSVLPLFERSVHDSEFRAIANNANLATAEVGQSARASAARTNSELLSFGAPSEESRAGASARANGSRGSDANESPGVAAITPSRVDASASRTADGITSRGAVANGSRRSQASASLERVQLSDAVQAQSVRNSPTVRYDVLLPYDPEKLMEAAKSQLCVTCGGRGGRAVRATFGDDTVHVPVSSASGALNATARDGRVVGRRVGPDSLPDRN